MKVGVFYFAGFLWQQRKPAERNCRPCNSRQKIGAMLAKIFCHDKLQKRKKISSRSLRLIFNASVAKDGFLFNSALISSGICSQVFR
jgi:hypothetical protein